MSKAFASASSGKTRTKLERTALAAAVLAAVAGAPAFAGPAAGAADPLWTRQCVKGPEGKDTCFVQQFAIAMPQKAVLFKVVFGYFGPGGEPRIQMTVPLGVFLPAGLTLSVDGQQPFVIPLQVCRADGCEATADLDPRALDRFRAGKAAKVRYVTAGGQAVELPIRLDGLTAALKTVAP